MSQSINLGSVLPSSLENFTLDNEPVETTDVEQVIPEQEIRLPSPPELYTDDQKNENFTQVITALDSEIDLIRSTNQIDKGFCKELTTLIKRVLGEVETQLQTDSDLSDEDIKKLFQAYLKALKNYQQSGLRPFKAQLEKFRRKLSNNLLTYEDMTYGFGRFEEHDGCSKNDLEDLMKQAFPQNFDVSVIDSIKKDIHSLVALYEDTDYEKRKNLCQQINTSLHDLRAIVSACDKIIYDQEQSADMSEKIARRDVVNVIISTNGCEELLDCYGKCLEKCLSDSTAFIELISNITSDTDPSEITGEISVENANTNEFLDALQSLRDVFDKIDSIVGQMIKIYKNEVDGLQPERPDDPYDPSKIAALERECARLQKLKKFAMKISDDSVRLHKEIVNYSENSEEKEENAKLLEKKGHDLINTLNTLIKVLKDLKKNKESILTFPNHPDIHDDINTSLETVKRFIRYNELKKSNDSINQYDKIREELRGKWEQLGEEINAGKDLEELIDLYIEIQRLQTKYHDFWNKKVNIADEIIKRIGNIVDVSGNYSDTIEAVHATTPESHYYSCLQVRNPLDSPFIKVIHELAKSGIGNTQWKNFFLYSNRSFTLFERGMFRVVLGKNIDQIVCDSETYEATLNIHSTTLNAPEIEIKNNDPQYYEIFKIDPEELSLEEEFALDTSIINLYTVFAMYLAFATGSDESREKIGLPPGHPIAALLVSKQGQILSWGLNTIDENGNRDPVRHAEINAISSYFINNQTDKIPEGATLFTSLRPCHMCAGGIELAGKGQLTVYYGQDDPAQKINLNNCSKVKIDIVKDIDAGYDSLKNEDNSFNAAKSLTSIEPSKNLKQKLINLGNESGSCFDHIRAFWKHVMPESLVF